MKIHCCVSVRGILRRLSRGKREARDACAGITDVETGRQITPDQLREAMMDELAAGHEVLPVGKPCEGFSYKTGCPGHEESTT